MKGLAAASRSVLAGLSIAAILHAHGGTYRGPGSGVPPTQGGKSNSKAVTGSTNNPQPDPTQGGTGTTTSTTTPPVPTVGAPASGTGTARRGPSGGGYSLAADYSSWTYWWEFNKGTILNLKARFRGGEPGSASEERVLGRGRKNIKALALPPNDRDLNRVRSALLQTLDDPNESMDVVSSSIMALAKLGKTPGLDKKFLPLLGSGFQEIRETAALALGLAGDPKLLPDLLALANDEPRAHDLMGKSKVDFRTRSFACYGLGKLVHLRPSLELSTQVFLAMRELAKERSLRRDIRVAALHAIAQIRRGKGLAWEKLDKEILDFLLDYALGETADDQHGANGFTSNHALTSLAELRGREDSGPGYRHKILSRIQGQRSTSTATLQSTMIALGRLSIPEDKEILIWIRQHLERNHDLHVRHMATIALGQIGGEDNRSYLRKRLMKVANRLEKPWLALAIAQLYKGHDQRSLPEDLRRADAELLLAAFKKEKNRMAAAGFAIALGLLDHKDAAQSIRDRLSKIRNDEAPASYLSLALGMLGDLDSRELLTELFLASHRRTTMMVQTSIALALLGDTQIHKRLLQKLSGKNTIVTVYGSISQALGQLGDRRSLSPLMGLLADGENPALVRAFAAVSLGLICSKEILPWNADLAANGNYMANVETLTGSSSGVLDIL